MKFLHFQLWLKIILSEQNNWFKSFWYCKTCLKKLPVDVYSSKLVCFQLICKAHNTFNHLSLHIFALLTFAIEGGYRRKQESLLCSAHIDVHRRRLWILLHSTSIWKRQRNLSSATHHRKKKKTRLFLVSLELAPINHQPVPATLIPKFFSSLCVACRDFAYIS